MEFKKVEEGLVPIYENETKERLINARELHRKLENKRRFSDWIKQRIIQYDFIENQEFIKHHNFVMVGNLKRPQIDYYITIDMAKELCMVENNSTGKQLRRYFIETEKRYRNIINKSNNTNSLIDIMQNAINYMKENNIRVDNLEIDLKDVKEDIKDLKSKIDIKIQNNYCLASDIAEQLNLYSENKIPHSNLIGAIARQLGYKISYKHYYEDEYKNKNDIYYEIQYVRNTKNGKKGEIKEKGYKIEEICYKII